MMPLNFSLYLVTVHIISGCAISFMVTLSIFLLRPVFGGVVGVAKCITDHEQTHSNRTCFYFISLMESLFPKALTFQNLFCYHKPLL